MKGGLGGNGCDRRASKVCEPKRLRQRNQRNASVCCLARAKTATAHTRTQTQKGDLEPKRLRLLCSSQNGYHIKGDGGEGGSGGNGCDRRASKVCEPKRLRQRNKRNASVCCLARAKRLPCTHTHTHANTKRGSRAKTAATALLEPKRLPHKSCGRRAGKVCDFEPKRLRQR